MGKLVLVLIGGLLVAPAARSGGLDKAMGILQALQGGGQQGAQPQAQAQSAPAMDPKDAAKMALIGSLISGKKPDFKEIAGQALAAKLGGGDPNDPKAALKAALAQKLLSGGRLDLKELASTAVASKLGAGDPNDPKSALKAALLQKLVSGQRVDLTELAGTAIAAKLGGRAGALGGGGGLPSPDQLSGRDRIEALLLQQLMSGERIDAQAILVQYLADKAEAKSAKLGRQNFRPGSKAALKAALLNELMGGGGLGGRLQDQLAATLQRKAGLQRLGAADRQALLAMIAPQAGAPAAPAVPSGYGAALQGGAPVQPAPQGYGSAVVPSSPSPAGGDQARVDALMAEYAAYQQGTVAPAPATYTPPASSHPAPPPSPDDRIAALQEELRALQEAQQQPVAPPPPPTRPAVVRSPDLQARIQALAEKGSPERIQIPLDSLPDAPDADVAPAPTSLASAASPAPPRRMVAGIDLDDLERRDPEAAAALGEFSPDVLEAAAALLAAQKTVEQAGARSTGSATRASASAPPPPDPARAAGPLASMRTSALDSSGARVAALRARRAAEEAAEAQRAWSAADREQLEEDIQEYVYEDTGITRFSLRQDRMRADARVRKTLEAVLAGEEAWPPVDEDAARGPRIAPRRQVRRASAAREYTVREKMVLHDKIRDEVFAREGISRFSNRADTVRAEAVVKTLVTQAMEDGSALDYLEK